MHKPRLKGVPSGPCRERGCRDCRPARDEQYGPRAPEPLCGGPNSTFRTLGVTGYMGAKRSSQSHSSRLFSHSVPGSLSPALGIHSFNHKCWLSAYMTRSRDRVGTSSRCPSAVGHGNGSPWGRARWHNPGILPICCVGHAGVAPSPQDWSDPGQLALERGRKRQTRTHLTPARPASRAPLRPSSEGTKSIASLHGARSARSVAKWLTLYQSFRMQTTETVLLSQQQRSPWVL